MSDIDASLTSDDPEPERVRRLLDALRDPPSGALEDEEGSTRRFFEELNAALSQREEPSVAPRV